MRRFLLAASAAGVLAAQAAYAHPVTHYTGECSLDLTDSAAGYTGTASVHVEATTAAGVPLPTMPISVQCQYVVDGVPEAVAVAADGIGVAAMAGPVHVDLGPDHYYQVCEIVDVGGEVHSGVCHDVTWTTIPPSP